MPIYNFMFFRIYSCQRSSTTAMVVEFAGFLLNSETLVSFDHYPFDVSNNYIVLQDWRKGKFLSLLQMRLVLYYDFLPVIGIFSFCLYANYFYYILFFMLVFVYQVRFVCVYI